MYPHLVASSRWHGDPATTRPIQGRTSVVGASNSIGGGDDAEDDDPTSAMDGTHFSVDPSAMNGLNGMAHDRQQQQQQQQQHVYINPQDLRENNPPPPPAPPGIASTSQQQQQQSTSAGLRSQTQQQHSQQQQQQQHSQQPPAHLPPDLASTPILNFPLTQDLTARLFHYLNLQAQIAQEKLDYLRRREARELKELNARKELEKTQSNRNKSEKAFVRVAFSFLPGGLTDASFVGSDQ
jgi:DNA primase